jgi:diguanylate cyclase (GGDEF)-like protein
MAKLAHSKDGLRAGGAVVPRAVGRFLSCIPARLKGLIRAPAPEKPEDILGSDEAAVTGDLSNWAAYVEARHAGIFGDTLFYTCLIGMPIILGFALWDWHVNPDALGGTIAVRVAWCVMVGVIAFLLTLGPSLGTIRVYCLATIGGSLFFMSLIYLLLGDTGLMPAGVQLIVFGTALLVSRPRDLFFVFAFAVVFPNIVLALSGEVSWRWLEYNAFAGSSLVLHGLIVLIRLDLLERSFALEYRLRKQQVCLTELASVDTLTKVWNRRHFFELCNREMARAARLGTASAILMLDLDRFKSVNDTYGHNAGDAVLVAAAACWSAVLRQPDILGRIGGEEFAVLLPDTPISEARGVAERLRAATEALSIVAGVGQKVSITMSIGCAPMARGEDLDAAMKRADEALYEAKSGGRNQVVVAASDRVLG